MRRLLQDKFLPLLALASVLAFGQFLLLSNQPTSHTSSSLAISASPRFGFAPFSTNVRITIEPDSRNRTACFTYEADTGLYSNSCWTLDGSSRTTFKGLASLPAGQYTLTITVERNDSSRSSASTTICSIPQHDPTSEALCQ